RPRPAVWHHRAGQPDHRGRDISRFALGQVRAGFVAGPRAPRLCARTLAQMRKHLTDAETQMTPPRDAAPPSLDIYTGTYESPVLGPVEVGKANGRLVFTLGPRQLPVELSHWSDDIFIAHIPLPVQGGSGRID